MFSIQVLAASRGVVEITTLSFSLQNILTAKRGMVENVAPNTMEKMKHLNGMMQSGDITHTQL